MSAVENGALVPDVLTPVAGRMPPEALAAFNVYVADPDRSLRKTAAQLNISEGTVRSWSHRYGWTARLRNRDLEDDEASYHAALSSMAALRLAAIRVLATAMHDADAPHKVRIDAATRLLDRAGMTPVRTDRGLDAPAAEAELDDAEIADAIAAGPAGIAVLLSRARSTLPPA